MFKPARSTTCVSLLVAFLVLGIGAIISAPPAETSTAPVRWEKEIGAYEAGDKTNPPPRGAILFAGSSSILLWKSLARDFPDHKVINRAFGGSQIEDSIAFAHRIIIPCRPKMIVLYAGDNDIAAGKSPERVFEDFKTFAEKVHATLPQTRVAFISIKPSPSRWHLADSQRAANRLVERHCKTDERLAYIDVFKPMLGPDGRPRAELFLADNLHLNSQGYELWTSIIGPYLK